MAINATMDRDNSFMPLNIDMTDTRALPEQMKHSLLGRAARFMAREGTLVHGGRVVNPSRFETLACRSDPAALVAFGP